MDIITLKDNLIHVEDLEEGCDTIIEEKQNTKNTELQKIIITGIPSAGFWFKPDKISFNGLFKGTKCDFIKNFNKHSDSIIVMNDKIVHVELKSSSFDEEDCKLKFISDLCTLDYADSIIKRLCGKDDFFNKKTKHYVVLYLDNMPKNATVLSKLPSNTDPSNFRKIGVQNGSEIPFGMLI